MLQRFIIQPSAMPYNLLQRQKAFIIFVDVDGKSHGHIFLHLLFFFFLCETSTKSFIYHGRTLNLDKVFGWWGYIFFPPRPARPVFNCIYMRRHRYNMHWGIILTHEFILSTFGVLWHDMWEWKLYIVFQSILRKSYWNYRTSVQDTHVFDSMFIFALGIYIKV